MEYMEEILKVYHQINGIYIGLNRLECVGNKDSVEFVELVGVLKKLIKQEKGLFDNFYSELEDAYEYQVMDNGDPFVKRLIDFMNFYDALNCKINDDDSEEEIIDKTYDMQYGKLYKSCSRNVFLIYLSFLQEYIDDIDNVNVRDGLLSYKYFNAFINHDVEECLIDFNFEVSKVNYVNLYFVAETLGIDINMCDNIILDCFKDTIEVTIGQILSVKDNDYYDVKKYVMVINNLAMLRAGFALISGEDLNKNVDWLYGMINNLSMNDNQRSVSYIYDSIKKISRDKTRVMKISMRQLKG